jgi:integrase
MRGEWNVVSESPAPTGWNVVKEEPAEKPIAACDSFGQSSYERRRARAMILMMWRYGLRVSDVATLERERVRNGRIFSHAMKNGSSLWLPLFADLEMALKALPVPQGAPSPNRYYFWTGLGSKLRHIVTVDRTLQAVFLKSGVERGTAHRFRHTLPPSSWYTAELSRMLQTSSATAPSSFVSTTQSRQLRISLARWSS